MTKVSAIGECMIEMVQQENGLYKSAYAGDSFNMTQYLAWIGKDLGVEAGYVTVLGRDRKGRAMLKAWEDSGIDVSTVMTTDAKNTGLYFADTDAMGNRDYTFYRSDSAAKLLFNLRHSEAIFAQVLKSDVIYASAVTLMILNDTDRQKLVDFFKTAKKAGLKTVFDTNYRASGWVDRTEAAKWMNAIMQECALVFATDDENREVFGDYTQHDTVERLQKMGIPEIVVKCGGERCLISFEEKIIEVPAILGIKVVDTTSAGDSFAAAYMAGRFNGLTCEKAAEWGHILAAEVIQHRGALIPKEYLPVFKKPS